MPLRAPRLTNSFTLPSSPRGACSRARPSAARALGGVVAPARARGVLDPLLGRLPLADRGLRLALDPGDLVALLVGDEGDRPPGAPDPAGAPDPVHVDLGVVGQVVVDDVGDVLDVEPAGGDVGGHQQRQLALLELDHHPVALALAHVAVQRLDPQAAVGELLVEPRGADLRAAEDDRLLGLLGPQHLDQPIGLLLRLDRDVGLLDRVDGELLRGHRDRHRVVHVLLGEARDRRRHRRREERPSGGRTGTSAGSSRRPR